MCWSKSVCSLEECAGKMVASRVASNGVVYDDNYVLGIYLRDFTKSDIAKNLPGDALSVINRLTG